MPNRLSGKVHLPALQRTSAVIGGKWKTSVLFHLAQAPQRFGALRRLLPGVSEKVLIQRLRELEADGVVDREVEQTVPPRVEYSLSRYGRSLCPVIEAMAAWGERDQRRRAETRDG